jgi:antitoxin PrlF
MELAKVTSKGQITLPVNIRRKLGVKEAGKVYILNASMEALKEAQAAFAEEAERVGLKDEDDIVAMIKQLQQERTAK